MSPGATQGDVLAAPQMSTPLRLVQDWALMVSPPMSPRLVGAMGWRSGAVLSRERGLVPLPSSQTHWKRLVHFFIGAGSEAWGSER